MSPLNPDIIEAYSVLEGKPLSRALASKLGALDGAEILDLLSLANKVRIAFAGDHHVCTIQNARSGQCGEDCRFCAQSAHNSAEVEVYPLIDRLQMIEGARTAYATGVRSFGIVTSGTGFLSQDDTFREIIAAVDGIHDALPDMNVCASLGMLSDETAEELARHGIAHYNINIPTTPSRYGELISTTHAIQERVETIKRLKRVGIHVCCGGILGLGESMEDRIEMAFALNELDVDVIPLNVLVPIEGTPLENQAQTPVVDVATAFALFRLINPTKTIKFAAGRETVMKDFQGLLMLAGANGMLTGGYLTTRGRDVEEDMVFIEALKGFATL